MRSLSGAFSGKAPAMSSAIDVSTRAFAKWGAPIQERIRSTRFDRNAACARYMVNIFRRTKIRIFSVQYFYAVYTYALIALLKSLYPLFRWIANVCFPNSDKTGSDIAFKQYCIIGIFTEPRGGRAFGKLMVPFSDPLQLDRKSDAASTISKQVSI